MLLTTYEEKALELFDSNNNSNNSPNLESNKAWQSVSDIGNCRLSTLNKLVEKGYLERIRRPGPYVPNESILFRVKEAALAATA